MNLVVRKPGNRLSLLDNSFHSLFDDFFSCAPQSREESNWAPHADIHETENEYLVQLDLPGIDKKDVKIKLEDNCLVISGERKGKTETEDDRYHRVERYHGDFCRTFRLYKDIDGGKIKASFNNGVLEVSIPKAEELKPKEIAID